MSKIVFLIGAGASFGTRGESIPIKTGDNESRRCANVISGVPVVNEIPGRLYHLLTVLKQYPSRID